MWIFCGLNIDWPSNIEGASICDYLCQQVTHCGDADTPHTHILLTCIYIEPMWHHLWFEPQAQANKNPLMSLTHVWAHKTIINYARWGSDSVIGNWNKSKICWMSLKKPLKICWVSLRYCVWISITLKKYVAWVSYTSVSISNTPKNEYGESQMPVFQSQTTKTNLLGES